MKIKEKEFEEILQELRSVADQLGASVRFEKGDFKGGYCIIHDRKVVVINKMTNLQRKVMILSNSLAGKLLDVLSNLDVYLQLNK